MDAEVAERWRRFYAYLLSLPEEEYARRMNWPKEKLTGWLKKWHPEWLPRLGGRAAE